MKSNRSNVRTPASPSNTAMRNTAPTKLLRTLFAALTIGTFSISITPAIADVYHAVDNGETLASIAKRYNVKPDALREANKLSALGDNSPLAAMLLRIPTEDGESKAAPPRDASTLRSHVPAPSTARYFGTVTRTISYTVRAGDTLESLAAEFSKDGQTVSVAEMRTKNNLIGQPLAGSTLLIPIKTVYAAKPQPAPKVATPVSAQKTSAQMQPPAARAIVPANNNSGGDSVAIGVAVSDEVALPFARTISASGTPSYQSPNATSNRAPSRGALASRGGYGAMVDGARILQNGEELSTTPSPRVRTTTTPRTSTLPATHNLARVAKVATRGARIRRLPDADAATLYNCGVGTEIAVLKQQGPWSAILMSDRSTGWLPTRYLKFTGTSVDITSQVETQVQHSDDSVSGNWTGGYESNHPAIRYALRWLGTPYRYGGESTRGIDCSSLMQKAFAAAGKRLPRVSRDQARVGRAVAPENLQPGDRLYFSASGTHVDHTGLYMGNGLYVHASGGARKVVVSRLREPRSWKIFVGARRF